MMADQASCPLDGSSSGLGIRGWNCTLFLCLALGWAIELIELLSCPFNLVLPSCFSTGAVPNILSDFSFHFTEKGLDLWLPARVC